MKSKKLIILAILYIILNSIIFSETIDGPANIRKEPNGLLLYSIESGENIEVESCKNDWYYVRLKDEVYIDKKNCLDKLVLKNSLLYNREGKIVGKVLKENIEYTVQNISKDRCSIDIMGYTYKENIKGLYKESGKNDVIENRINGKWINIKYDDEIKRKKTVYGVEYLKNYLMFSYLKNEKIGIENKKISMNFNNLEGADTVLRFIGDTEAECSHWESLDFSDSIKLKFIPEKEHIIIDNVEFRRYQEPYYEKIVAGNYLINETGEEIQLDENCNVFNFKNYIEYSIEYLFVEDTPRFDCIIFKENNLDNFEYFHWKWSKEGNLELYSMTKDKNTGEYGIESKIGTKIYTLIPINRSDKVQKQNFIISNKNGKFAVSDSKKSVSTIVKYDYVSKSRYSDYIICCLGKNIDIYDKKIRKTGSFQLKKKPFQYEVENMEVKNGYIRVFDEGKYGYVDIRGDWIKMPIYEFSSNFNEERAVVKEEGKWKIVNSSFEVIKSEGFSYPDTDDFYFQYSDGLIPAIVTESENYGYIDKNGNIIIPGNYEYAYNFVNGIAIVSNNGKYGCINKNGKEVVSIIYDEILEINKESVKVRSAKAIKEIIIK